VETASQEEPFTPQKILVVSYLLPRRLIVNTKARETKVMTQFYSDPLREVEPNALPDCEVFYIKGDEVEQSDVAPGWYWWSCFPGCLPDCDPIGPFESESDAIADARHD
jgi:hypothetical protein